MKKGRWNTKGLYGVLARELKRPYTDATETYLSRDRRQPSYKALKRAIAENNTNSVIILIYIQKIILCKKGGVQAVKWNLN